MNLHEIEQRLKDKKNNTVNHSEEALDNVKGVD